MVLLHMKNKQNLASHSNSTPLLWISILHLFLSVVVKGVLYIAKINVVDDRFCFPARTSMSASVVRDLVRSYAHPVHLNSNGHVYDHLVKAIGLLLTVSAHVV